MENVKVFEIENWSYTDYKDKIVYTHYLNGTDNEVFGKMYMLRNMEGIGSVRRYEFEDKLFEEKYKLWKEANETTGQVTLFYSQYRKKIREGMGKAIILIGIPKNAEKKDGIFVMPKDTYPTSFFFELSKQIWFFFAKHLKDFVDDFTEGSVSEHKIPKSFFKLLADNIEGVLEDPSKAPGLLPVLDDLWIYNPADYGVRYFLELECTSKNIKKILTAFDFEKDDMYYTKVPIH